MLGRISQHALHRCRLQLIDQPLGRASLFPFFDHEGRVRSLMLTAWESSRILVVDWQPDLFVRRWPRRNVLKLRFADLRDVEASEAELVSELWHFDPWWVLGDNRFATHPAVPALRWTNIPGYDTSLTRVWFDSRLSRVTHVAEGQGEALEVRRFDNNSLAHMAQARGERPLVMRNPPLRGSWRLSPF